MIGIIDSGSGGFNVIRACSKYFKEDYVYIYDDLNGPYGNMSVEKLETITKNNIDYLIKNYNLDLIIIACNTASSILDIKNYDIKVPILKTNPNLCECDNCLLFATKNTIEHNNNVKFYLYNYNNFKTVYIKDLPKFIDEYLENKTNKNKQKIIAKLKVKFCNKKGIKNKYKNIKYLSLGCTHFKHIELFLNEIFKNKITYVYCEEIVAKNAKYLIRKNKKIDTIKVLKTSEIFNH